MRKHVVKLFAIILLLILFVGVFSACNSLDTQFEFEMSEDGYTITKYIGNGGVVKIPEKYKGVLVTEIGERAFSGSAITEITVPINIKKVGFAAFENCNSLHTITTATLAGFGNLSLEYEYDTFKWWFGYLKKQKMELPQPTTINITSGGTLYRDVFLDMKNLKEVNFIDSNSNQIPANAFHGTGLEKITFAKKIQYVGYYAFQGAALKEVDFLGEVVEIGDYAFSGCDMKELVLPNTLKKLGKGAFFACSELESIVFEGTIDEIKERTFEYCGVIEKLVIPDGVKVFEDYAFYRTTIKELILPQTLKSIGKYAIEVDGELVIPASVETLNEESIHAQKVTFASGSKLKDIPFMAIIFNSKERNCELTIPSSVETMFCCQGGIVAYNGEESPADRDLVLEKVYFENANGWYLKTYDEVIPVSEDILSDAKKAADFMNENKYYYILTRNP